MLRRTPMTTAKPTEPRACTGPGCVKTFIPFRPMQSVCGPVCARRKVEAAKKQERAQDRETREKQKGLPQLHKEAREAVHEYIRLRDAHLPCISCGAPPPDLSGLHAGRDAGHYRSVGSAPQHRYNPMNINAQCVHCNQHLAGNPIGYRFGMLAKYGEAETLALELDNAAHKWSREEVRGIRDNHRAKVKQLKREAAL